jgi:hypothetical protein
MVLGGKQHLVRGTAKCGKNPIHPDTLNIPHEYRKFEGIRHVLEEIL